MALPVSAPPPSSDIAISGWSAITVRIAWTLLSNGFRVNRGVLRDARAHVLYHISPRELLENAEDRAGLLTQQFIRRAQGFAEVQLDLEMPISPRWRRALEGSLNPIAEDLLKQHYVNSRPIEYLERTMGHDRSALESTRAGLREIVRRAARNDGVPMDGWSEERVDALLARLAAYCPHPCPPLLEVVDGTHAKHIHQCVRCSRTVRLLQMGALDVEDLLAPSLGARPYQETALLALEFHPEGQMHRSTIVRELECQVQQFGEHLLFLDWSDPAATSQLLQMAAEIAAPHRAHLRGVVVEGPGHWTMHGLVGPLSSGALKDLPLQSWGKIDRIAQLPPPLPPPPSANRLWASVATLGVITAFALKLSISSHQAQLEHPIEANFIEARGGIWVDFDVDEEALVSLVSLEKNQLRVILDSQEAGDKVQLALGDGRYRIHAKGEGVLLSSSDEALPELASWIRIANQSDNPLQVLAQSIQQAHPDRDTAVYVKE